MIVWRRAQAWERGWWGDCVNTHGEEEKQLLYARRMGLRSHHDGRSPYNIALDGRSVVDVGGGPCSLLLKCVFGGRMMVIDPLEFPAWVLARYECAGIEHRCVCGEDLDVGGFDEAWIYNVLQHARDPRLVVERALAAARLVRVFEWIDTSTNVGHPHLLSQVALDAWFGGHGKTEQVNGEAHCVGKAYYGIFPGRG